MESGQFDLVNYITRTLKTLCEGELIQTNVSNSLDMTRDKYYDIIYRKTASLLGTCCGAGALASGADHTAVAVARQIGDNLGMAFQIKDDLLDYAPSSQTGKPTCADLKEHKITLPLLLVLEEATPEEQSAIKDIVRTIAETGEGTEKIYALVERADAVHHSIEVMESYLNAARSMIKTYPESPYRDAMLSLCDYIGKRSF
jgi:octaprenyl-diphosphate synthase